MINRAITALPALLSAGLALGLALLYINTGWVLPVVIAGGLFALVTILYLIGRTSLSRYPRGGGRLVDVGLAVELLVAVALGAVLIWLSIEKAPSESASTTTKEAWTAASGALTAFFGAIAIDPEGDTINPLKNAIQKTFKGRFTGLTGIEKDAHEAVRTEAYSPVDPTHEGQVVDGWGWAARRIRTRHIADALQVSPAK